MILDRVWEDQFDRESNVVEVYINYLRRKIGPGLIHTKRGAGYVMEQA
jgi:DNA-binding response OmpR family regulator